MAFNEDLEKIIKRTIGLENHEKVVRGTINTEEYTAQLTTRDAAGKSMVMGHNHVYHKAKLDALQAVEDLTAELDKPEYGGYDNTVKLVFEELSEEGKMKVYAALAEEVLGEGASDKLKEVATIFSVAKTLEGYIQSGDGKGLGKTLGKIFGINPNLLLGGVDQVHLSYMQQFNSDGLVPIGVKIVDAQKKGVYKLLKENKEVQGEIEKGIAEHKPYGRATMEVYKVYNSKDEQAYRKKAAEKAA